tara:strand:+ start:62 stop:268 length:207 start_codon:yes stop_codon:yes gene_type:complete
MENFIAEATATNPMYTHIILGKEEGGRYFTRAGGYMPDNRGWAEFSGHYGMGVVEALTDFITRLERGY